MEKTMNIFAGKDGESSWRKIMTACALVCFMTANMGYLITNNFTELPPSYQAIIAGVFVFYFGKNLISNTRVTDAESIKK
jgi:uncharacterized membrane protein